MTLLFILIFLGTGLAVAGLITLRWTAMTEVPVWGRVLITCGIAAVFMSPFCLQHLPAAFNGTGPKIFTTMAYFGFVCVFLFFCLMIARDVVWIGLGWLMPQGASPFNPGAVMRANVGLLIAVILMSGYALWAGTRVPMVRELTLASDKVDNPLTIAVLPDIHIHRFINPDKLAGIVARTNALKPDAILLPGDIIDDTRETVADPAQYLAGFRAPLGVFATDGNHEIYVGPNMAHHLFQENHITYLHNDSRQVRPDVIIAGVPDIQSTRLHRPPDMAQALPAGTAFKILLAHSPKMFDMPGNTADLQVSGHTHGGQIFPFHFLAWLSNKYLAGLYRRGNRTLYVSRGAGQWGPQMRLLAPSEITLIHIVPATK